jgi:hypothetical protein
LTKLNYAMITLIPKEQRQIILKSLGLFAKLLNSRLVLVAYKLIASNQTSFIKR